MNYAVMVVKSSVRNRTRALLTIVGMGVAVLAFVFLRTVIDVWNAGVTASAEDRLATRHKVSITMPLPKTYYNKILDSVPDVAALTYANWFGGVYSKDEHAFFANFAVDGTTYFDVYNEVVMAPDQRAAWMAEPSGAVVGQVLAAKYGWKLGDKVTLTGTIYPGDWTFIISGFYTATTKAFDQSSFFFHWKYLNDGEPESMKETIGWLGIRVKDPSRGAAVARSIDKLFDSSEAETLTESERAFNLSFISMYSALFTAIDIVSIVILVIMTMIVGNTIAMGVRERTHEYGVLRAIGFKRKHLLGFVLGETLLIALFGGLLGIGLAWPLVNGFGVFITDNMGSFFPFFALTWNTVAVAATLSIAVGLISAVLPAVGAMRIPVTGALRRLG